MGYILCLCLNLLLKKGSGKLEICNTRGTWFVKLIKLSEETTLCNITLDDQIMQFNFLLNFRSK